MSDISDDEDDDVGVDDTKRAEMVARVQKLLNTEGRSEEEAAAYIAKAMEIIQQYDIDEAEARGTVPSRETYISQKLDSKYANGWRVFLADAVARNTGVVCTFKSSANAIWFFGREHSVKGAVIVAEYLISTTHDLSKIYARKHGTGTKGRRDFAEGCGARLCQRIRQAADLASDPRLPAIYKSMLDAAKDEMEKHRGRPIKINKHIGDKRSGYTESYTHGIERADTIDLRGHQRTKELL